MKSSTFIHQETPSRLGIDSSNLPGFLDACIRKHQCLLKDRSGLILKDSPESAVTLVDVEEGYPRVCVKELRWRGLWYALKGLFRPTPGVRTYHNGWRLIEAGIGCAAPLALLRMYKKFLVTGEWVIMEVIPETQEMDRYIVQRSQQGWSEAERSCFSVMFGRFIGNLHSKGIFHSDLKTCNILVAGKCCIDSASAAQREQGENVDSQCEQGVQFFLLDYDDVQIYRYIPERKVIKNLVQIFLSTPSSMGQSQRLSFLEEYGVHAGINPSQRQYLVQKVFDAVRGREILYIGLDGDVREPWSDIVTETVD
ncbi:MAG: lipopolysaccharide kinase InaA family protein [Syntrophaceae bacterium]